ncbi:recombinase family protein [Kribbella pittospori]|uniref:recombinase family protein n=1 Tax=Kribbella pittospori TaxID=722689 RepID=UPI001EDF91C5|nr:recombinase family protein [Kribbella pittospori]
MIFHVFAALGEFIREMIVQGTREGLDAAKARGTRLGRPPAMNEEQVRHAKDLLGNPENTVSSIARLLGVSRATIYKYVPELRSTAVPSGSAPLELPAASTADQLAPMPKPPRVAACPTCGYRPSSKYELQLHREGLETVWLLADPEQPGTAIVERTLPAPSGAHHHLRPVQLDRDPRRRARARRPGTDTGHSLTVARRPRLEMCRRLMDVRRSPPKPLDELTARLGSTGTDTLPSRYC